MKLLDLTKPYQCTNGRKCVYLSTRDDGRHSFAIESDIAHSGWANFTVLPDGRLNNFVRIVNIPERLSRFCTVHRSTDKGPVNTSRVKDTKIEAILDGCSTYGKGSIIGFNEFFYEDGELVDVIYHKKEERNEED